MEWWSQPYAAEGSVAADGISRQLGTPNLDPLTILVREAAQNSWDARLGEGLVSFSMALQRLDHGAVVWRRLLAPDGDSNHAAGALRPHLEDDAYLLTVSDRGARGLGGPLRADIDTQSGVPTDFCSFVRNAGEARRHAADAGGGTYGFGKGIFYRVSRARTILIDTHVASAFAEGVERRLMGAALGDKFTDPTNRRFTGRHWWGETNDDTPDPLVGDVAETLAAELGLPGFADGRTGTDVVILGADLGSNASGARRTPEEAAIFLASSMLWNLWPKFDRPSGGGMTFEVSLDGEVVDLPPPAALDTFKPFLNSLDAIRGGGGKTFERRLSPTRAATLATSRGSVVSTAESDLPVVSSARPFTMADSMHHVARMRTPELVVDYWPGPVADLPGVTYGGVFRATHAADAYFAESEPPTHDAWVTQGLGGTALGVVRDAHRFLKKELEDNFGVTPRTGETAGSGVARLSRELAGLLPVQTGDGASTGRTRTTVGGSGRRVAQPTIVHGPSVIFTDGGASVELHAVVQCPPGAWIVRCLASVRVEGGGIESEPPAGSSGASVLGWRTSGAEDVLGDTLTLPESGPRTWVVRAPLVDDAVVRLALEVLDDAQN